MMAGDMYEFSNHTATADPEFESRKCTELCVCELWQYLHYEAMYKKEKSGKTQI